MRSLLICLLLPVCLIPSPACCFLGTIQEICPDTYLSEDADEYLVITPCAGVSRYTLTDGEGEISFSGPFNPDSSVTIAREASAYYAVHGRYPDYEIYNTLPEVPDVSLIKRFQLANTGDDLTLYADGKVTDQVFWPQDFVCRRGQVHYRDSSGEWDPRVLLIGQSRLSPKKVSGVSGTVFVSPDCGRDMLLGVILDAEEEILVNVYESTDTGIADALCSARSRGVMVSVLIEGGPVGGIPEEEKVVISRLQSCNIPVTQMGTVADSHAPYRYDHAKYIVADNRTVLVTSENFTNHSLPPAGTTGNRGWGIVMHDSRIAAYYRDLFFLDRNGPGVSEIPDTTYRDREEAVALLSARKYTPRFAPLSFTNASVSVVVSPDTSSLVTRMIDDAETSVCIEQAYIRQMPDGSPNPYLLAAIDAARRGVVVQILLDSYWYNVSGESDNDEMVSLINALGKEENIPIHAKCIDLASTGLLKIHTKGVIVDKKRVLISSINWNENSPTFNRETGIIIDNPDVGAYYSFSFSTDWEGTGPVEYTETQDGPDPLKITLLILIICSLVFIGIIRRKRFR
ncbi:MAG: phospholipase [Methanospirillaceae archaeon]|nr:phospholipase [Methanospirillaceae archaeon]